MDETWDVIVVGGGAAGLSAALVLGRARRRVLVVDAGSPSNAVAHGIGGLLGHDGRPPAELYAMGRAELAQYPTVEVRSGTVAIGERTPEGFLLDLDDGTTVHARRVLLATGMDYRPPVRPGIAERWGRTVFHCPFCHGWEVRERPLGVLDDGDDGIRRALLLTQWSDDVTLLTDGPSVLEPSDRDRLAAAGVAIDEREVDQLLGPAPDLDGVRFTDGSDRPLGGLLVPVTLHQRSTLAEQLGARANPANPLVVDGLEVDAMYQTTVPGVYAAGDLTGTMPSVASSVFAGSAAAAMIVHDLALQHELVA